MGKFKNIPLKLFRNYLLHCGLKHIRTKGGHEIWSAKNLTRPVVLQTHVDSIPEFIIKIIFAPLDKQKNTYWNF